MIKYTKTQKPDNIEEYFEKLTKAGQDNWIHSHNEYGYMIFLREEKKKTTRNKKPRIEETILYKDNKDLWKRWSEQLKESYKEFRTARWQTHKDYVSPLAEKKLLKIVNKYNENISKQLMGDSLGYKSIVEKQEIVNKGLEEVHKANKQREEDGKRKEQEKTLEERRRANEAIQNSGKSKEYWEKLAMEELRKENPTYTETMLGYQVQPRVRIILKREGFL